MIFLSLLIMTGKLMMTIITQRVQIKSNIKFRQVAITPLFPLV